LRVLVVDDERLIADTLAVILWQHGYYAEAAYSGEAGLRQAQALNPDLVISDVLMPDMSGTEMAIQIRQFLPACRILLFSGQAATADLLEEAAAKGYTFEIMTKPVHPQNLLARLENLRKR
jgi:DNA-binding response OmpR family regulator